MLVSDSPLHGLADGTWRVLILVLVDVGLGLRLSYRGISTCSLNPCFSGCWSRTCQRQLIASLAPSLNPCFSGCWSRTGVLKTMLMSRQRVLILVLVDVGLGLVYIQSPQLPLSGLNPCFSGCWSRTMVSGLLRLFSSRLNPCFSGCWSRTCLATTGSVIGATGVLILVLVDVGLGPPEMDSTAKLSVRLNPCFSGCWSRTWDSYHRVIGLLTCLNPCFSGCWSRTAYTRSTCPQPQ